MADGISVFVVDAHRLFRDALVSALGSGNVIRVTGVADSAGEAVEGAAACRADVVVYAEDTPGMDLFEALQAIRRGSPSSRILLLVEELEEPLALKAIESGASGYVRKDQKLGVLAKAIACVHRGEYWIGRKLVSRIIDQGLSKSCEGPPAGRELPGGLTPREREVLRCLAKGYTNRRIGEELFISEKTVKTHLGNIYAKLEITKRVEAIISVARNALKI